MSEKCPKSKSRNAELMRRGWLRRFVAEEPKLSEAVELYKSLGYEVRLEPAVFDEASEECKNCLLYPNCEKYKTIYIRLKKKKVKS